MQLLESIGLQSNTQFEKHTHHQWEIVYYVRGDVLLTVSDRQIICQPGSMVFLPPHQSHDELCTEGYTNYYFTVSSFDLPIDDLTLVHDLADRPMQQLLSQIFYLFHTKSRNWHATVESLLVALRHYVTGRMQRTYSQPLVEQFISILVDNISNDQFSLQEAYDQMPMSADHFRLVFKRETGRLPLQYLNDMRMQTAKNLLRTNIKSGRLSIQTVARLSGFADPYYFSRAFRKATSYSPLNWLSQNAPD